MENTKERGNIENYSQWFNGAIIADKDKVFNYNDGQTIYNFKFDRYDMSDGLYLFNETYNICIDVDPFWDYIQLQEYSDLSSFDIDIHDGFSNGGSLRKFDFIKTFNLNTDIENFYNILQNYINTDFKDDLKKYREGNPVPILPSRLDDKLFSARDILEKLSSMNPNIRDRRCEIYPHLHKDIEEWYFELYKTFVDSEFKFYPPSVPMIEYDKIKDNNRYDIFGKVFP